MRFRGDEVNFMRIILLCLTLAGLSFAANVPWSRSAMQMHGGTATLSAMTNSAATLDLWVDCNYVGGDCLAAAPVDQNGNRFTFISRQVFVSSQREHYRLQVKGSPIETVLAPTDRIGEIYSYSILLDSQSTP
jgi:hypothetical protein